MPKFGKHSLENLQTLHIDLQRILKEAIKYFNFSIIWGFRNEEEQNKAYAVGNSKKKWPNSKHNQFPSLAVDLAPWPIDWKDTGRFYFLGGLVCGIGYMMGIKLRYGGFWKTLKDLGHFEMLSQVPLPSKINIIH